jgi:hypothetical protein
MPFPRPVRAYSKHKDLANIASETSGDLLNLRFFANPNAVERGEIAVQKTLGYARYTTNATLPGAKAGLGLGSFQPSTGTYTYIYAAWDDATPDTQIYSLRRAVAGTAEDPTSEGATARFSTNGNAVEFEQAADSLYITNGVDAVLKRVAAGTWSALSSGEPLSGSGTVAKYLSWHNFMMFAARTVNAPNKLSVSNAGAPETYSGNTQTLPYSIVGLKPLGDLQVVYTKKTVHTIQGYTPTQLSFQTIENPQPCVSHRSIVQMRHSRTGEPVHVFLGADYVWMFNGTNFEVLGRDGWESIRSGLNTSSLDIAAAVYDAQNNQYRISVATGANTTNNTTYAFDFNGGKWIQLPGRTACAYTKHGSPNPSIYWQEASALGLVAQENSGNNLTIPATAVDMGGGLLAGDTELTVDSTTGFPTTGKIVIESETIRYTGVTSTTFTGLVRGSDGTTAATHANNTAVYVAPKFQYKTLFLDAGEKNLFKKYQVGWASLKSSSSAYNLDVAVDVDQYGSAVMKSIPIVGSGAVWGSFSWGDGTLWGQPSVVQYPNVRFPIIGRGKEIEFTFSESANIQQTELYDFEYRFRPLKKR